MGHFELICIFKPNLNKEKTDESISEINKLIESASGSVIDTELWGVKDLAYTMQGNKTGFYFFSQIEIEGKNLDQIRKKMVMNENIIRSLFVKVNEHEKLPSVMMQSK